MKCFFHYYDCRGFDSTLVPEKSGQLDGGFVCLTSRIAEEGAIHSGQCAEPCGKLLLFRNFVQVGKMHCTGRLSAHCFDEPRVGVAQSIYSDPADAIKVAVALSIPQPRAFAPRESDCLPPIGCHYVLHHVSALSR